MASNLLWAHLLRKDATGTTTTTESLSQIPPIAPQDKTATSMRMLIHDTQVNLEKFSTRLDGLFQRVDDCRAEVVNANKLLDVERDKVLSEILEIANRCHSGMKVHVGTPAQAPALDLVHVSQVSTERSVQALEKRIDALQTLVQTHAHVMQSIQDQQNTIIGAQMDQIKALAVLPDMVANAVSTMTASVENFRSTLVTEFAHGPGCARSSTRVGSSMSGSWRKPPSGSVLGTQELNVPISSPLDSRSHGRASLKRARVEGDDRSTRKLSRLGVPLTSSGDPPPLLRTPRTPRQPFADLLLPPPPRLRGYMRPLDPSVVSSPMSRPSPQPRSHLEAPTVTRRRSPVMEQPTMGSPNVVGPSDPDVLSMANKTADILKPNLTDVLSVHSSPLSSLSSSLPLATGHDPNETSIASTGQHMQLRDNMPNDLQDLPPSSNPVSSNPDASPPKSMSLRDRRAQICRFGRAEARRFIPLVPWSDEEE